MEARERNGKLNFRCYETSTSGGLGSWIANLKMKAEQTQKYEPGVSRLSAARLSSVFKLQAKGPSADCQKPSSSDVKSFSVLPSVFCRNTEALSFHRAMKPIVTVLGTYSEVNRDRLSMQHFEILFILNLSIAPLNAIIHIPRPKQIRIVCDLVYCLSLWLAGLLHGDFVLTTVGI